MSPLAPLLLAVGAFALAAFAYRRFGRGGTAGALFVITVAPDSIRVDGEVPGRSERDVRDFIERMELPRGARMWAHRDGSGLRMRFSTEVPDNLRQRARNFFGTTS